MKIRIKLVLLFTTLFVLFMVGFAVHIYYSAALDRERNYYDHLKREAITKANLLLGAKVPEEVLQVIYKNAENMLYEEEVAIYDTFFNLVYHDAVEIDKVKETSSMIEEIKEKKEIRFSDGKMQIIGLSYLFEGQEYVLTAAAVDNAGFVALQHLSYTLGLSLVLILVLSAIAGYYFAGSAVRPVEDIVKNVAKITATSLDKRIPIKNRYDEIGELAITFNDMLDRLETSFQSQRNFVSNISHELRTPLAILVGELELALNKARDPFADQKVIETALLDARKLVKLSNDLLDFAKANYDQTEIAKKVIRVDEVLLDARDAVLKVSADYKVELSFDHLMDDDVSFSMLGNEYLLRVAFFNLIENACKFSNDYTCNVHIIPKNKELLIQFKDRGVGIAQEDMPYIFKEFYRGSQKQYIWGTGIGLSLTKKIVDLHDGQITVVSTLEEGTIFSLLLPSTS